MKFIIWSPGYNCAKYAENNILSVLSQTHKDYLHIVVDDATTDGTENVCRNFQHDKMLFFRNDKNEGWLYNAIKYLDPHVTNDCIIVSLDLDDWLAHNRVLEYLNKIYSNEQCWITYGSLINLGHGRDFYEPDFKYNRNVIENKLFRKTLNFFSHLRTFRGFLWNKINKRDLLGPDGKPLKYSSDVGYSLPILEMTPKHRIRHIREGLYFYNNRTPLNDHKIHQRDQRKCGDYFRSLKPYKELIDNLGLYEKNN